MKTRVGFGSDLHRLEAGLPLIIGGVAIDASSKGCVAHSDGDALLHALIDALLGSLALGDIGDMFPPTDDAFKGVSSEKLLSAVLDRVRNEGYELVNLDSVIHLESPHLFSYKPLIVKNLVRLTGLTDRDVSVKAKTREGVDAVGNGLAIEVQVVVLVARRSAL